MRLDGSFHNIGRVGGGLTDEPRVTFLSDLKDMVVGTEYTEVNSDRVAYEMVKPERVIEISCLDLVSETTRGGSIDRMVLHWNEDGNQWEAARRLPLVSVISPQFERIRDDKKVHPDDVSLTQLTGIVEIDMVDKTAEDLSLPRSEIMKREVRVKALEKKFFVGGWKVPG
jgi:ATP-dependent DNA ligase